jgi:hypothetical protein
MSIKKRINISDILDFSWKTLSSHIPEFLVFAAINFAIWIVTLLLSPNMSSGSQPSIFNSILSLLLSIFTFIVSAGYIQVILKIIENKKVKFSDYFYFKLGIFSILGVSLIVAPFALLVLGLSIFLPAISAGLLVSNLSNPVNSFLAIFFILLTFLLILGFIYLNLRVSFSTYYIIDKNLGPIKSLKVSWKITKGRVLELFLFNLVTTGINILGLLAFGIGLFLTVPLTDVASIKFYQELEKVSK